jgi:hypothetical protein
MALPASVINAGPDAIYRFCGGRARYNAQRRGKAEWRRVQVARLLLAGHGQAEIARQLGVNRSTISRDVQKLQELWQESGVCPVCGSEIRPRVLAALHEYEMTLGGETDGTFS